MGKKFLIDTNILIDTCIALRKTHHIKLPDAIIAATALVHDLTLISRNISDFKRVGENSNFIFMKTNPHYMKNSVTLFPEFDTYPSIGSPNHLIITNNDF